MEEKQFYVKQVFLEDIHGIPLRELLETLRLKFVDRITVSLSDQIWPKIPAWVNDDLDPNGTGIEDETDGYALDFEDETATYVGYLEFYYDKDQWKKLDKNYDVSNHKENWESLRSEVIVKMSDVFEDPQVDEIYIEFDGTGNSIEYQLYPKCNLPRYMSKDEMKRAYGAEWEEDE